MIKLEFQRSCFNLHFHQQCIWIFDSPHSSYTVWKMINNYLICIAIVSSELEQFYICMYDMAFLLVSSASFLYISHYCLLKLLVLFYVNMSYLHMSINNFTLFLYIYGFMEKVSLTSSLGKGINSIFGKLEIYLLYFRNYSLILQKSKAWETVPYRCLG